MKQQQIQIQLNLDSSSFPACPCPCLQRSHRLFPDLQDFQGTGDWDMGMGSFAAWREGDGDTRGPRGFPGRAARQENPVTQNPAAFSAPRVKTRGRGSCCLQSKPIPDFPPLHPSLIPGSPSEVPLLPQTPQQMGNQPRTQFLLPFPFPPALFPEIRDFLRSRTLGWPLMDTRAQATPRDELLDRAKILHLLQTLPGSLQNQPEPSLCLTRTLLATSCSRNSPGWDRECWKQL